MDRAGGVCVKWKKDDNGNYGRLNRTIKLSDQVVQRNLYCLSDLRESKRMSKNPVTEKLVGEMYLQNF